MPVSGQRLVSGAAEIGSPLASKWSCCSQVSPVEIFSLLLGTVHLALETEDVSLKEKLCF